MSVPNPDAELDLFEVSPYFIRINPKDISNIGFCPEDCEIRLAALKITSDKDSNDLEDVQAKMMNNPSNVGLELGEDKEEVSVNPETKNIIYT